MATPEPIAERPIAETKGEVLIVEDNPESAALLAELLAGAGYTVRQTSDGETALWSAALRPPDLMLLDIRMPGIDGFEVCRRLKANPATADIPVIFLSIAADTQDKVLGLELGAVDYIVKPYQPGEVLARVATHVTLARLHAALAEEKAHLEERVRERTAELQERQREAARIVAALDMAGDGIMIVGADGRIGYGNSSLARVLCPGGIETILGKRLETIAAAGGPAFDPIDLDTAQRGLRRDGAWLGDLTAHHADGGQTCLLTHMRRLSDGGWVVVFHDVTEPRRLARETTETLLRAKKEAERVNLAKAQFLAAASHDLRQPLQAQRLCQTLLEGMLTTPRQKEVTALMAKSLEASETLLNALLDVSALECGAVQATIQAVPVQGILVRLATEHQAAAASRGLSLKARPCSCTVASDPTLLERLLRNLVCNALRYTPAGGRILLACRDRGTQVSIQVWDTGVGIAADKLDRIFEDFYQIGNPERDRTKGLGLGLAVVKRTADVLGHRIDVRSRLGRGSVFSITAPKAAPVRSPLPGARTTPAQGIRGVRILLVEDDPLQLAAMEMVYEDAGAKVTAMSDTSMVEAYLADLGDPTAALDIVVSDYRLPNNRSGIDVVERVRRATGRRLPAIIVTGDLDPSLAETIRNSDCSILHKPCSQDQIFAKVEELIRDTGLSPR